MHRIYALTGLVKILLFIGRASADGHHLDAELPKLECKLIIEKDTGTEGGGLGGFLVLQNTSRVSYKVSYMDHPFEHLALEVRDAQGKLLPNACADYGAFYRQLHQVGDKFHELTIKPGGTYRHSLALLGMVDQRKVKLVPGSCTVQAVFRNNKQEFRSERKAITIIPE